MTVYVYTCDGRNMPIAELLNMWYSDLIRISLTKLAKIGLWIHSRGFDSILRIIILDEAWTKDDRKVFV